MTTIPQTACGHWPMEYGCLDCMEWVALAPIRDAIEDAKLRYWETRKTGGDFAPIQDEINDLKDRAAAVKAGFGWRRKGQR